MSGFDDPVGEARELIADGKPAEAVRLLRPLIDAGRGGILARVTLGRAHLAAGETDAALATLREANFMAPNLPLIALAFGETLLAAGALPAAVAEFQRALRLDPQSGEAHLYLARAWLDAGEPEKARDHLVAAHERGAALADIADLDGKANDMAAAPRSAEGYVRHLFDQFSADYDQRMIGTLGYRAPQILLELWTMLGPPQQGLTIVDLGCGTGLTGRVFKPFARRLVGVDLSPKMIEKARQLTVYDELIHADIDRYLQDSGESFDLCLAADVLVYLGDLASIAKGVARSLKAGGLVLLTVEAKEGDGFALGPKRRWQHSQAYLRSIADDAGLAVAGLLECVPRYDAGQPIAGFAAALRRTLAEKVG